jgi:hypothetical protein
MKMFKGIVERWRSGMRKVKRERAMKIFSKLMNDPESGASLIVSEHARKQAFALVMSWLDAKRIMHCKFCPNTESLRTNGVNYFCEAHRPAIEQPVRTPGKIPLEIA